MPATTWIALPRRGILSLSGKDVRPFLQGLITNDVDRITPSSAIYAALLTPQGRFLHDFFIAQFGDNLLLDTDRERLPDLARRLTMYRLRAKVEIRDESQEWRVIALPGRAGQEGDSGPWKGGIAFTDPRTRALGRRALLPADVRVLTDDGYREEHFDVYERLRISLGVPDGARDCIAEKTLALEGRLDDFNGISFDKGCYVGQEVTARMKHRNLVKRSLVPVSFKGAPPDSGTPVTSGEVTAGEVRSAVNGLALALLRLDLAETGKLSAARQSLTPTTTDQK